jgi:hypothetical protein
MMTLAGARFRYEPFPVGLARNVFAEAVYEELLSTFPDIGLFRHMQYHGSKYSLSELNNPENYYRFLEGNARWRALFAHVKSAAFIDETLKLLRASKIDLGLEAQAAPGRRGVRRRIAEALLGAGRGSPLSARFEFSMMPAQGGHIIPHTDSPQKLVTLVISMLRRGEWQPEWGGGTDMLRPRDPSDNFNYLNRQLPFEDVVLVDSFAFEPNQCVIFIKTFNSLHAVRAMRGPAHALRRTLTINIEASGRPQLL